MIWLIGQFHGVMKPQTPIGSRDDQRAAAVLLELVVLEHGDHLVWTWPMPDRRLGALVASQDGAPISIEMASAMSS